MKDDLELLRLELRLIRARAATAAREAAESPGSVWCSNRARLATGSARLADALERAIAAYAAAMEREADGKPNLRAVPNPDDGGRVA